MLRSNWTSKGLTSTPSFSSFLPKKSVVLKVAARRARQNQPPEPTPKVEHPSTMSDKKRSKSKKGGKQSASSSSSSSASAQALSPLAQRLARCSRQTLEDALLEILGGVSGAEIDRILGEEVIQCPTSAALHVPSRSTFECVSPLANALLSRTLTNHTSAHAPHTRRTRVRTRPLAGKAPQTERGVERGHVLPRARHGSVRSDQFGERKYG